jgi:AcrR family transcriptional regulator
VAQGSQGTNRRLASGERKALLIGAAERTFASRGYTQAGLAEVADIAGVSKTLLYHYFPQGRPELYRNVMDRLAGHLVDAVRAAVRSTDPPDRRLAAAVVALFRHFEDHPDSYRLLLLEPWGSGDPGIVGHAMAVRARLAGELSSVLSTAGAPLPTTLAGTSATLGAVLHVCELWMSGEIDRDDAAEIAGRFVEGGLASIGLATGGRPPG